MSIACRRSTVIGSVVGSWCSRCSGPRPRPRNPSSATTASPPCRTTRWSSSPRRPLRVGVNGGVAQRLTTHPEEESRPAISPDGRTVAFAAGYEGPARSTRCRWTAACPCAAPGTRAAVVVSWTPQGEILYATRKHSTLPNVQLCASIRRPRRDVVPLSQASDGAYDAAGKYSSSRGCRSRAATRAATRVARRRTCGGSRVRAPRQPRSQPTTRARARRRCCGRAASTMPATATA